MKIVQKINVLFGRYKRETGAVTSFSKKLQKQPHYTARIMGTDQGKKSLREKILNRGKSRRAASGKEWLVGVRRLLIATLAVALFFWVGQQVLMGPMQGLFDNWEYFRIQRVDVSGCRMTTPAELKRVGGISYQLNMLTLDPIEIKERLIAHPWISVANIQRVWPDGLVVTVEENHPEALIVSGEENGFSYINRRGKIFTTVKPGQELDFPVITGLDDIQGKEQKEKSIAEVLLFLKLTKRNNPNLPVQNISEIHLGADGGFVVYLVKHPFPIYFGKGEIKNKYVQLWKVLEVLYQKRRGGSLIEKVAYIRMDYQNNKVLVARSSTG